MRSFSKDISGISHFLEHMFFKGTQKRTAFQIISRLEDVGGEINAYTTKEETALYASFLKQDYRRALELISDIFIHSTFPEKEREKEAEVILNEIQGYDESPSELIFEVISKASLKMESGSVIVMDTSREENLRNIVGFDLERTFGFRVHKSLTRYIGILRKN